MNQKKRPRLPHPPTMYRQATLLFSLKLIGCRRTPTAYLRATRRVQSLGSGLLKLKR